MAVSDAPEHRQAADVSRLLLAGGRRRAIKYPLRFLGMLMRAFPVFLLSPFFKNLLKFVPHLWFYVIFRKCYKKHRLFRQIWDRTPTVRASGLIELGGLGGLIGPISADRKREIIDEAFVPVFKLNWRLDFADAVPGTFIHYLLATIPNDE